MTLTLGGGASGSSTSGTTCTSAAFSVAPTVGKKILVGVVWYDDTPRSLTVTDNASGGSNTYAACGIKYGAGQTYGVRIYEAVVDRTNASFVVTVTGDGDIGASRISCLWIDGNPGTVNIYGGQVQGTGSSATNGTTTGALGTPSSDGCFVFGMMVALGWPDNVNAGTGYTALHGVNALFRTLSEYLIQTTASAVAGTFTKDNTDPTITVAVVIAPTGGGGSSSWGAQLSDQLNRIVQGN